MPSTNFSGIPAASLVMIPEDRRAEYIRALRALPVTLLKATTSAKTGAYILGLAKTHDIPLAQVENISFAIFEILIGKKILVQLPSIFSTELQVANDKAQTMAREVERDLIAPISSELNRYLADQKKIQGSISSKIGKQKSKPVATSPALSPTTNSKPEIRTFSTPPSLKRIPNKPAIPPNILDLKKKWEQPKPPPIPN
ncbi:MAG: hypothetical protein HYR90_05035 [Candidatus Andersenbacteria bacterium]|nr:hypothetical protein [Candidatus Andersenbacteria bacterium]MBI3250746.1 hypothetical protein [Candidatus Andersenbacteria bacterium]